MKATRFLVPLLLLLALPAFAMTDSQVIAYIKTQAAAGKSQDQIGKELLAKGVTPDQIQRLKKKYENGELDGSSSSSGKSSKSSSSSRKRTSSQETSKRNQSKKSKNSKSTDDTEQLDYEMDVDLGAYFDDEDATKVVFTDDYDFDKKIIYGHEIFETQDLTFEPNINMATPQDYRLGPGDEVIIDIWGASEDNIREEISPDGRIMISQLGPIYLNGMTVAEANKHLKNIFASKYAGVGTDTDINLTLGNIRTIQVDVMGEVNVPGTFRLSPFANVFHAIYNAGGINDIGTMRNIDVMRNGKRIASVDFYDFLFRGKDTGNIRLQEGDVIIVPPYSQLVNVEGNVKRPMYYELKSNESLSKLLEYAGGFSGDAYSDVVRIERLNGLEKELFTVGKNEFPYYMLRDGDLVTIGMVTDRYSNMVELKGAVNRPGTYAISSQINTVKDLLNTAEGVLEDAYLDRALIYREKPDRSLEVVSFNLRDLLDGTIADIPLNKNDIIEIANINTITERGDLYISGYVAIPGGYRYAEGMTVEDLVLMAGGLLEGASLVNIEVSRRIVDQTATDATNQLAQLFTLNMENGIVAGKDKGFKLKPYDIVFVRKSPTYTQQSQMEIDGQVLYPGAYTLKSRNERLSEIIKRAGGLLESAYVKGAYLKRKYTEEQMAMREETERLARATANKNDSIQLDSISLSDNFTIGIDLQKAIDNPGSTYDVVLQPGDLLFVPQLQSTVTIMGEVLYPNSVVYVPGKKLSYYIDQAGGYGDRAKKSKSYIVYMNGSVAKAKRGSTIEPGCQIIVPKKPESTGFDWGRLLSITSTLGTLTSVAATVVAITR